MPGCEICGEDPRTLIILPIHQPNGSLITLACEECAEKSSAYCRVHHVPHQGFEDGTSACLLCIELDVQIFEEGISNIFREISNDLQNPGFAPFVEWLNNIRQIRWRESENTIITRAIITYARRMHIMTPDIFKEIEREHNANMLIPPVYLPEESLS